MVKNDDDVHCLIGGGNDDDNEGCSEVNMMALAPIDWGWRLAFCTRHYILVTAVCAHAVVRRKF